MKEPIEYGAGLVLFSLCLFGLASMFGMFGHEGLAAVLVKVFLYFVAFGLSLMAAQYRMDGVRELRLAATCHVSEWPDLTRKQFRWMASISPNQVWEEDCKEWYAIHKEGNLSVNAGIDWGDLFDRYPSGRDVIEMNIPPNDIFKEPIIGPGTYLTIKQIEVIDLCQ